LHDAHGQAAQRTQYAEETRMTSETRAAEDPRSDAAVDVTDAASVRRWTEALGTTDEALLKAVLVVGTRVDRIKDYLGAGGMAADQEDG
jgi:hypothetical protein